MTIVLFPCNECHKKFTRSGDLKRHSLIHLGIKANHCKICGKSFSQPSGLKTHMNTHTNSRPHRCGRGDCAATFNDPSSASRHRKEAHSSSHVYECPECHTCIKRRSAFTTHLKKHGDQFFGVPVDIFYRGDIAIGSRKRFRRASSETSSDSFSISSMNDAFDGSVYHGQFMGSAGVECFDWGSTSFSYDGLDCLSLPASEQTTPFDSPELNFNVQTQYLSECLSRYAFGSLDPVYNFGDRHLYSEAGLVQDVDFSGLYTMP